MTRVRTILIIIAAAGAAGFIGYRNGYSVSDGGTVPQTKHPTAERKARPTPDLADRKESIGLLLKRPMNSRTRGELWSIVGGYSISEIGEALHEIPANVDSGARQTYELMLYQRWAQIDPLSAAGAASAIQEEMARQSVVGDVLLVWMKTDPDAAYRWAEKSSVFKRQEPSRMMANLLSGLTPAAALEKAESYGPEVRKATLLKLGDDLSTTPEDRTEFLAELARSGASEEEKAACLGSFAYVWGGGDPLAALGGMDDLPLSDAGKEKARDSIVKGWTQRDPEAALSWVVAKENAQPLKSQVDAYTRWAGWDAEAALSQLDQLELQSPALREGVMNALAVSSIRGGWTPWSGGAEPTTNLEMIKLKSHYNHWSERAPENAAAWLANQEPGLRKKITAADVHENR